MLNSILDLLRKIEQDLDFSFNMKFGYLNADISLVGNGLRISTIINIPSIVRNGKIINVIKASNNNNIQINKLNGFDEIYTISNKSSNKGTEIFILENTINFIDDINNYEMRLSQEKYESQRLDFEDRIYRAQAIFNSARIIRLSEAEQILGDLKTGNALGIIDEKYNEWLEFLILNRLSKDNFSRCV
jgi:protein arginine kinase